MPGEASVSHPFQADVSEVLHLVIHSLYSHKEIFLRELISNASDALDKLRFRAITDPALLEGDIPLEIQLIPDREAGTLTVRDTGVGMSREDLMKDLGTIARSGSRAFLEKLRAQGASKDLSLIGQFGVGFYSAFLVADQVSVVSSAAGTTEAFRWSSDGKDAFTLEPTEGAGRGTQVILKLKEDQKEFLDDWRLRDLVARYSDYVNHPIKLVVKDKEPETINRASALWQRPRSEITDEQYQEFFKHLTHSIEPALAYTHFKVEGKQEFTGLLFFPKQPPFDLELSKRKGVRLFVKRVFIMEDCEEILPQWLRFVRGVVDSDDLPLNVSRELLQDSQIVRTIKKQVTKKALDLLEQLSKDRPKDYEALWTTFGAILKEGLALETENKDRIAELIRYRSSHGDELVSLADYYARMPLAQPAIYYVLGESLKASATSPHTEALRARGYEVLYMSDPVDEWATEGLHEYKGKPLVSAMRADLKLDETEKEKSDREQSSSELKPLLEKMKEVLNERVRDVRITSRLTDSPCCLVASAHDPHAYVERLLRDRGHAVPKNKRVLEVNGGHPLVKDLEAMVEKGASPDKVTDYIEVLYEQALLTEGSVPEDPNRFAKQITELLAAAARAATT